MQLKRFIVLLIGLLFFHSQNLWAKTWDPQLLQASNLAYQGDVEQALSTINDYIKNNPQDPAGLFVKAIVLDWKATFNGLPEESSQKEILEIYKKANTLAFQLWDKDRDSVDKLIDLGNSYLFLGKKYADTGSWFKAVLTAKKCQQHLEKAQKLDDSRVDGLLALGGFHYLAANTPPAAEVFKGILGIKGSKPQGLAELKRATTGEYPFVNDTRYGLIEIYTEYEKDYPEALRSVAELEKQFPNNPEIKMREPRIEEHQDKLKGANSYLSFAQWCEGKKDNCDSHYLFFAYYNAGRIFKELGQNDKALDSFAKALTYNKKSPPSQTAEAIYWSGLVDLGEGKADSAIEKFKKAKDIQGIPKKIKKEIEKTLSDVCNLESNAGKC